MNVMAWLGVLFIALKLTGVIDWSWWWVTAPFWLGFTVVFCVTFLLAVLFAAGSGGRR